MLAEQVRFREPELERRDLRARREQQIEVLSAAVERAIVEHFLEHRHWVPRRRRPEDVEVALRELHVGLRACARAHSDAPPELAGLGLGHVDREVEQVLVARHLDELEARPGHRELVLEEPSAIEVGDRLVHLRHVDALARHRANLAPNHMIARVRVAAHEHVTQRLLRAFLDLEHERDTRLLVVALLRPTDAKRAAHAIHAGERRLWVAALAVEVLDRRLVAADLRVVVVLADFADQQRQHLVRWILHLLRRHGLIVADILKRHFADHVARSLHHDKVDIRDFVILAEAHICQRDDRVEEAAAAIEEL